MSSSKYIQDAVSNVEDNLHTSMQGCMLPKKVYVPWLTDYCAELDTSLELDSKHANYYQSQIGVLHLIIELGQVDIQTEESMLASQMALPHEGHLDVIFRVFGYLKTKHNSELVLDPSYPEINHNDFFDNDWTSMYGNVKEAIPPDNATPLVKEVDLCLYATLTMLVTSTLFGHKQDSSYYSIVP